MAGRPVASVPRRSLRYLLRLIVVCALALAALLLGLRGPGASAAPACDKTWTGNAGSLWTAGGSWSPSGVPTSAQYVCILSGTASAPTVAGTSNVTVQGLRLAANTLTVNGSLTLSDTSGTGAKDSSISSAGTLTGTGTVTLSSASHLDWNGGGSMSGTGTTTFAPGSTVAIDGSAGGGATVRDRTVDNNGTMTLQSRAFLQLGTVTLGGPETFDNGGTITFSDDSDIIFWTGFGATLNNSGTIKKPGGTGSCDTDCSQIGVQIANGGTISAQSGDLQLSAGGDGSALAGTFTSTGAGRVSFTDGTFDLGNGSKLSGTVDVTNGAIVAANGAVSEQGIMNLASGGDIGGSGTFTVQSGGTLNWSAGGRMEGAGTTVLAAGSNVIVDGTGGPASAQDRTITNNGTVTLTNLASLQLGTGMLGGPETFDNAGTITLADNSDIVNGTGFGANLNNSGTLQKTGGTGACTTDCSLVGPRLNNTGTVSASSGVLRASGGDDGSVHTGVWTGTGGGHVSFGSAFDLGAGSTLSGTIDVDGGGIVGAGGSVSQTGTLNLNAGGAIGGPGTFTVQTGGTLNWNGGGAMTGTGTTVFASGSAVVVDGSNPGEADVQDRTVVNHGDMVLQALAQLQLGTSTLSVPETFDNTGTITFTDDSDIWSFGGNGATLSNAGTIQKTGGTQGCNTDCTDIDVTLDNTGTLAVRSGVLFVDSSLANLLGTTLTGGTYQVVGSTLQLPDGSSIATNGAAVVLDGAGAAIVDPDGSDALAGLAANAPAGSLTVKNGQARSVGPFTNGGIVVVGGGSNSSLTASGSGYTQTGGSTSLTTATSKLIASGGSGNVTVAGGVLSGIGTVQTQAGQSFANAARVAPGNSPGILHASASYTQSAGGTLPIEIGGTAPGTQYDRLAVTGNVSLGGALALSTINGFTPATGQTFAVLTYTGARAGTFSSVTGDNLDAISQGLFFKAVYDDANKQVNVEVHQAKLSIADATVTEPATGTVNADFAVTLSEPRGNGVTVAYATSDGTATAPADYTSTSGTLTWAAGDGSTKHILVPVNADALTEPDEAFTVTLSGNSHATIQRAAAVGTIHDNPNPVVTGYSVGAAAVGKKITISGSHFTGATRAAFTKAGGGTVAGTGMKVVSDTQITVKVPKLATTGPVSVTNPAGTGVGPMFKVKATIAGFSPPSGPVGTVVTISGTAFTGASKVQFGKKAASFTVDADGQITATVPAGATTGVITITTPGGKAKSTTQFIVT